MQAHGTRYHDLFDQGGGELTHRGKRFVNGQYNSCANRCYYACFQAAIAALLAEGIRARGQWSHEFVQGQFVGVLINQRHLYDTQLQRVLADNQNVREKADYRPEVVNATQASRALRRTRTFVAAVQQRGGVV
jgi:uncharacterized protein (UPF0332 family)